MERGLLATLQAIASMPLEQKRARYSELAGKVAALVALTDTELHELIMLRNQLQKLALDQKRRPPQDPGFSSPVFLL